MEITLVPKKNFWILLLAFLGQTTKFLARQQKKVKLLGLMIQQIIISCNLQLQRHQETPRIVLPIQHRYPQNLPVLWDTVRNQILSTPGLWFCHTTSWGFNCKRSLWLTVTPLLQVFLEAKVYFMYRPPFLESPFQFQLFSQKFQFKKDLW